MANIVHPTAIIGPDVVLGEDNVVGPYTVLSGRIKIGSHNYFGAHLVIENNVSIGDYNRFAGMTSVGAPGEMGSKGDVFVEDGAVVIGDRNVIREFVTINSPVRRKTTSIGNGGYFMARTHVPHDACIGNSVVMATNSLVGGGAVVGAFAYIGLGSVTHQWVDIGEGAMVGLQAAVTKHVPPYCTAVGVPARVVKLNRVGAERRGIAKEVLDEAEAHLAEILTGRYESDNAIVRDIRTFLVVHPGAMT